MKSFVFSGEIPASKSILNRLLILQSHASSLEIEGHSACDDVRQLKQALLDLADLRTPDAGSGGTTLRFLAARATRITGRRDIKASVRLLERPQTELTEIYKQLGVKVTFEGNSCIIEGEDWKRPKEALQLSMARSSQFASGVLLNAWNLPFALDISLQGEAVSTGYLDLTRRVVEAAGMTVERAGRRWKIPAGQKIKATQMKADADVSSAFSIAALGALGGSAEITNFPLPTTFAPQPDVIFVSMLEKMGAICTLVDSKLTVKQGKLRGIEANLKSSPDLFPVLATLCAFADGPSILHGAPQLAFKESARIGKTAELIRLLGRTVTIREDGLQIDGRSETATASFDFDPDQDHRLAMAAGLARVAGADVRVTTPEVVNKSYPEFWDILQASIK